MHINTCSIYVNIHRIYKKLWKYWLLPSNPQATAPGYHSKKHAYKRPNKLPIDTLWPAHLSWVEIKAIKANWTATVDFQWPCEAQQLARPLSNAIVASTEHWLNLHIKQVNLPQWLCLLNVKTWNWTCHLIDPKIGMKCANRGLNPSQWSASLFLFFLGYVVSIVLSVNLPQKCVTQNNFKKGLIEQRQPHIRRMDHMVPGVQESLIYPADLFLRCRRQMEERHCSLVFNKICFIIHLNFWHFLL